jgi:hypothetical protein
MQPNAIRATPNYFDCNSYGNSKETGVKTKAGLLASP